MLHSCTVSNLHETYMLLGPSPSIYLIPIVSQKNRAHGDHDNQAPSTKFPNLPYNSAIHTGVNGI